LWIARIRSGMSDGTPETTTDNFRCSNLLASGLILYANGVWVLACIGRGRCCLVQEMVDLHYKTEKERERELPYFILTHLTTRDKAPLQSSNIFFPRKFLILIFSCSFCAVLVMHSYTGHTRKLYIKFNPVMDFEARPGSSSGHLIGLGHLDWITFKVEGCVSGFNRLRVKRGTFGPWEFRPRSMGLLTVICAYFKRAGNLNPGFGGLTNWGGHKWGELFGGPNVGSPFFFLPSRGERYSVSHEKTGRVLGKKKRGIAAPHVLYRPEARGRKYGINCESYGEVEHPGG